MRMLQYINLLGVLALGGVCVLQWQTNRRLNLRDIDSEISRQEQAQRLMQQERELRGCQEDLNDFRERLETSEAAHSEIEKRLAATIAERDRTLKERDGLIVERNQAIAERDQCKANVDKWAAAVKQRDEALKKAGEQIATAGTERNAAIEKFNGLASKYNEVVKDLNEMRARLAAGRSQQ